MFDGLFLKRLRLKKGYSMAKLAKDAGCSINDISRYENQGRVPRPGRIKKLAATLGVSEIELANSADPVRRRLDSLLDELSEAQKAKALAFVLELLEK